MKFGNVTIKHILSPVHKNKDRNYNINTFLGETGGNNVEYLSTDGEVLTFQSVVPREERTLLTSYRSLVKKYINKPGVMVGSADLKINKNYYLTGYNEEKRLDGSYLINWEFTEYMKPNIVRTSFKRIGKSATKKKSSDKNVKPKNRSTYITILLTDCGTLKYGMSNKKCVKYLQRFLQKKGYYKGYKVDGDYLQYTKAAVNQLQKANKIKVSKTNQGQWDKVTRDYWRKKYNIKK